MPTQEIPTYEWSRFFDEFSRRHEGWLVTVEVLGGAVGNRAIVRDLPLEGISVDPNEVGEDQITITAGNDPEEHLTHTIASPDRVWLRQTEEGAEEALEIAFFGGELRITFLSTALPELVDGVFVKGAEAGRRQH